jgi:cholesterol transport system auxiliary component
VRSAVTAALAAAALAGCANLRPTEAHRYFVLDAASSAPHAMEAIARDGVLLVGVPTVAAFYDTKAIAFSRTPGQLGRYQHSSWAEPPGRALTFALLMELEARVVYRTVAAAGSGVRGRVLLSTHLAEIRHDASSAPGIARVTLVAELIDLPRRGLMARRTFVATSPAASHDAAGAAEACGRALATVVADVADWVASVPTP